MRKTITNLNASAPIVQPTGLPADQFRIWLLQVQNLGLYIGTGSPEGSVEAEQGTLYMDDTGTAGNIVYIKRDAQDATGDKSKGWILIQGVKMFDSIINGITTVIAADKQASAAKSAARTAANASLEAAKMSREAADTARFELINRFAPALEDYNRAITMGGNELKTGAADVMDILQRSTSNASQLLANAGANASKAILGSRAFNQGVPRQSFEDQFAQIEQASPQERAQREAELEQRLTTGLPGGQRPGDNLVGTQRETLDKLGSMGGVAGVAGRMGGKLMDLVKSAQEGGTTLTPEQQALAELTPEDFMADVPTGRMVRNPDYISGEGWSGGDPQIWQPYTDEERQKMGYEAYKGAGAEAALEAAKRAEIENRGKRDPRLPDVAALSTPTGADYVSDISTGAYAEGPGYFTSVEALEKGQAEGLRSLAEGTGIARKDIKAGLSRARGVLNPYEETGRSAMREEAALSGALGPEAQQAALDAFIESPGQKYLREQQERSLLRNTAAIGGLGGGNVRTALQEQAMGIAATDQQRHLTNLRSLAERGYGAAGQIAGLETGAAANLAELANALGINSQQLITMTQGQLADLAERTGIRLADIQATVGAAQADLAKSSGDEIAGVRGALAGDLAGLRERQATTTFQGEEALATRLANLATLSGSQAAQYTAGAGSSLAAGEYLAGKTWGQTLQGLGSIASEAINKYAPQQIQPVQPQIQHTYAAPNIPTNYPNPQANISYTPSF